MCIPGIDPLTAASVLASTGGAMLNSKMQNDAISAQNQQNRIAMNEERAAREAETVRQRQFEQQQADAAMQALAQADPERVSNESEETVAAPENPVTVLAEEYNVPSLQGQVQNQDVSESIGSTIAGQTARTRDMLRSAALLQAQGGEMNDVAQALFGMGSTVANTGSNRRGSMNAARLETNIPAASVQKSSSPIGDLLMLGGQMGAGYGGQKAGFGAKPVTFGSGQIGQLGSLY